MLRVVNLSVSVVNATGFEVAIASTIRELRAYDLLDKPHQDVKILQIFKAGNDWFGVFWVTVIGSPEPIDEVVFRTPEVIPDVPKCDPTGG